MASVRRLYDRCVGALERWGAHPYPTAIRELCAKPQVARVATCLAVAACIVLPVLALFLSQLTHSPGGKPNPQKIIVI